MSVIKTNLQQVPPTLVGQDVYQVDLLLNVGSCSPRGYLCVEPHADLIKERASCRVLAERYGCWERERNSPTEIIEGEEAGTGGRTPVEAHVVDELGAN